MRLHPISFAVALASALAVSGLCADTIVLDEPFTDGVLVGGADPLDAAWSAGGAATAAIVDDTAGPGADNAVHSVRIEIVRTDNSQNLLRFFWDNDLKHEVSTTIAGGGTNAFTHFTLGTGSTEVDLFVDDVRITRSEEAGTLTPIDLGARRIDWTRAGVEGGIPDYAAVVDFQRLGGDPTGATDNSPLLQSLISSLTQDTVIQFPAGLYRFNRRINLHDLSTRALPGVIIRGAGTRATKCLFMDTVAEDAGMFDVAGAAVPGDIAVQAGLTKGSTSITLQSAATVSVGAWLLIRQNNDPAAMETIRSIPEYADTINDASGWARRTVGQIVRVTAVQANVVTIDRALHLDLTWANPTATVIHMNSGIGFEDFTIEDGRGAAGRSIFDISYAVNCWVQRVHSLMAVRCHLIATACANLTIRESYFNNAYRHDGGGHGYGTLLGTAATHCLVENNVFRNLRHSMIWKQGANGNVFAYNYSTDGNQDGSPVAKDISGHGHYAFGNLFEGNVVLFIHSSDYWGPIGPNNMFLRNRTTAERILIEDNTRNQSVIGNALTSPTAPFVVVDASSTGAFVHGNSEGGALQWRSDTAQSVVNSYFYVGTPAYWNIPDPWPSIGPEYTAGQHTIPAKHRWDTGQMGLFVTAPPAIVAQLVSIALDDGGGAQFTVQADSFGAATYQWRKDGVAPIDGGRVSGATTASLTLSGLTPDDTGSYTVVVTNPRGSALSTPALLSLWNPSAGKLVNLSTRGQVLGGNDILIGGFVIAGSAPKTMLIRGIGPSLGQFVGPASALPDSVLTVYAGSSPILTNDDWGTQTDTGAITQLGARLGAFPLAIDSADAVLAATLAPGAYSAHLSGKAQTGLGLFEPYDGNAEGASRLMNISTRGRVGTGDAIMVPGFVLGSAGRLLIRGIGPQLAASFGFAPSAVLPDPVLSGKDSTGATIATNDDWSTTANSAVIAAVTQQVGAFPLSAGGADAALLVDLAAGVYTAQVADSGAGQGIAIVEVYVAP